MASGSFAVHKQGALVLTLAASDREDAPALVRRLLDAGVPANISDSAGFSALSLASRGGSVGTVAVLLQAGASANLPTRDHGNPPLFWAARGGHGEVVQLLLDGRAAVEQQNVQGDVALMWACRSGADDAAKRLLDAWPASLSACSREQKLTPLMCASAAGHLPTLRLLLGRNPPAALINARDVHGRTALHFCVSGRDDGSGGGDGDGDGGGNGDSAGGGSNDEASAACAALLLDVGADWRARDAEGRTALVLATRCKNGRAAEVLRRAWQAEETERGGAADADEAAGDGSAHGAKSRSRRRRRQQQQKEPQQQKEEEEEEAGLRLPESGSIIAPRIDSAAGATAAGEEAQRTHEETDESADDDEGQQQQQHHHQQQQQEEEGAVARVAPRGNPVVAAWADGADDSSAETDGWTRCTNRGRRTNKPTGKTEGRAPRPAETADGASAWQAAPGRPLSLPDAPRALLAAAPERRTPPVPVRGAGHASPGWKPWKEDGAARTLSPTKLLSSIAAAAPRAMHGAGSARSSATDDDGAGGRLSAAHDNGGAPARDVEGAPSSETSAWRDFASRQPTLIALDVQLRHLLGGDLEELSMAQISELLDVQRLLVTQLEDARLSLARRQERELVEERMIQVFETRLSR